MAAAAAGAAEPHVRARYSRLAQDPSDADGSSSSSFGNAGPSSDKERKKYAFENRNAVPWRSLGLAAFLLLWGILCTMIGYLMATRQLQGDSSQMWSFFFIGAITLMPGFYESRIAYYSWRGARGYSFSQIPNYY